MAGVLLASTVRPERTNSTSLRIIRKPYSDKACYSPVYGYRYHDYPSISPAFTTSTTMSDNLQRVLVDLIALEALEHVGKQIHWNVVGSSSRETSTST